MNKKKDFNETEELLEQINNAIINKHGYDLLNLNLEKLENSITKYFVICHGSSNTHVNTIAENIQREVKTQLNEKSMAKRRFRKQSMDFIGLY